MLRPMRGPSPARCSERSYDRRSARGAIRPGQSCRQCFPLLTPMRQRPWPHGSGHEATRPRRSWPRHPTISSGAPLQARYRMSSQADESTVVVRQARSQPRQLSRRGVSHPETSRVRHPHGPPSRCPHGRSPDRTAVSRPVLRQPARSRHPLAGYDPLVPIADAPGAHRKSRRSRTCHPRHHRPRPRRSRRGSDPNLTTIDGPSALAAPYTDANHLRVDDPGWGEGDVVFPIATRSPSRRCTITAAVSATSR